MLLQAVRLGQEAIAELCTGIEEWATKYGKQKLVDDLKIPPAGLDERIVEMIGKDLEHAYKNISGKKERGEAVSLLKEHVKAALVGVDIDASQNSEYDATTVSMGWKRVESRIMRNLVLNEGQRADGRGTGDVRPIWSRASILPRTHGSALFTRGETQAIAVTTLGCKDSAQKIDSMASEEDEERRFYLQYFFPPSSVGETGRIGAPGRREIGHGNLAERALVPVVPSESDFPYTIRVESTITESNGSSSMASVCGGCLSMMDAGELSIACDKLNTKNGLTSLAGRDAFANDHDSNACGPILIFEEGDIVREILLSVEILPWLPFLHSITHFIISYLKTKNVFPHRGSHNTNGGWSGHGSHFGTRWQVCSADGYPWK